jgi:hypothetical protein
MHRYVPLAALLVFACGDESTPAGAEASSGAERAPSGPTPLPAPYEATLTMQLRAPLSAIAAQIDAQLPERESKGMEPLTREGQSPAIEASYDIWRDPVALRFDGGVLHVDVPLRYAARFNARVKSPFGGWLKLAKDEPWGTKKDPQRVTLRVHTKVRVNKGWELKVRSSIDPPEHGAPPGGKLCTGGSFKLCVPKDSVAPEVRRRIDGEIVPRMQQALDEVDRSLQAAVALRSRVEQAWQTLAQPRQVGSNAASEPRDRWAVMEPRQAALELRADGDAIVVDAAVFARVSHHDGQPQPAAAIPLPNKSKLADLPGERRPLPPELAPPELALWLRLLSQSQ